jgi:hypothetical protein
MDGDAMLGPLPGHFQFVWQFYEEFGYHLAYHDRETGETVVDDPRLGPLPTGWRKKNYEAEGAYSLFVEDSNSIDGLKESDREEMWDPMLIPEALAARNVDLIFLELV